MASAATVGFFFPILREQRQRILLLIYNKEKGSCLATAIYIGTLEKLAKYGGPHQANKTENLRLRSWILVYDRSNGISYSNTRSSE